MRRVGGRSRHSCLWPGNHAITFRAEMSLVGDDWLSRSWRRHRSDKCDPWHGHDPRIEVCVGGNFD